MTETDGKVIEILTQHEVTADAWGDPIHAVDRAMGWDTARTKNFLNGLIERELVVWTPIARDGRNYDPKACWKKGSAHPQYSEESA
jgi:hypothetical protein